MTFKFTVQYDGGNYVGWQRQAAGISIQGLIEDALRPIAGGSITVNGAGRTDAGVHALEQVASARFETSLDDATLQRALNAVLPPDVRIARVERAADGFHARFSARAKTYEYRVLNAPLVSPFEHRYVWHVPHALDVEAMRLAARAFVGSHDFAAFQSAGGHVHTSVRAVSAADVTWQPPRLAFRITADGFLRHMVRAMAGTLVEVGSGRLAAGQIAEILDSKDRARAGPTAPPHGLFLISVDY